MTPFLQPSYWGSQQVKTFIDASGVANTVTTHVKYNYTPSQTTLHVILHEFGGHGLGNDHINGVVMEHLADEYARNKMLEYGFAK